MGSSPKSEYRKTSLDDLAVMLEKLCSGYHSMSHSPRPSPKNPSLQKYDDFEKEALKTSQRYLKFLRLVILNLFQDLTLRTKTRC
jgi:hypothetical protein